MIDIFGPTKVKTEVISEELIAKYRPENESFAVVFNKSKGDIIRDFIPDHELTRTIVLNWREAMKLARFITENAPCKREIK